LEASTDFQDFQNHDLAMPDSLNELSDLVKQHTILEDQLGAVDKQQVDLTGLQWKLVRSQTGTLTQELVEVRREVEDVRKAQEMLAEKLDASQAENETFETRLKGFVRQLFEKLEGSLTRLKDDQTTESDTNRRKHEDMLNSYHAIGRELKEIGTKHVPIQDEVKKLRMEFNSQAYEHGMLKEQVGGHAQEQKSAIQAMAESNKIHQERMDALHKERLSSYDDMHSKCLAMVDETREMMNANHELVMGHVGKAHADVLSCKEEVCGNRGKLAEVQQNMVRLQNEQMSELEGRLSEPKSKIQVIERQVQNLQTQIAQENGARRSLADVFEQTMKTESSKLQNLIAQKTAYAKMDTEEIVKTMHDKIDKHTMDSKAAWEALSARHEHEKNAFHDRISTAESLHATADQRFQSIIAELRDLDSRYRKMEDSIEISSHETIREISAILADERSTREVNQQQVAASLNWLGDTHDKMRDLFMAKNRMKMRKASPPNSKDEIISVANGLR